MCSESRPIIGQPAHRTKVPQGLLIYYNMPGLYRPEATGSEDRYR